MKLDVSFRNVELTEKERDALKLRARRKFEKVARYLKDPNEAALTLTAVRHTRVADLQVKASGDQFFGAKVDDAADWVSAIDAIMNKLARTVRRRKERQRDRSQAQAGPPGDGFLRDDTPDIVEDLEDEFQLWTEEVPRPNP